MDINGHGHSCDHVTAQEGSLLKILYITNSGNFSNESNNLYISVLRDILWFMCEVKLFDFYFALFGSAVTWSQL